MNQLNKLTSALNIVRAIANKILAQAVPIIKELENKDNELVDEVLDLVEDISEQMALELLQDTSLYLIRDAETVVNEIDAFSDAVIQGDDAVEEGENDYPFLMQVWCGDTYGEDGIEGLKALASDLQKQLVNINEDDMIKITIEQLQSE